MEERLGLASMVRMFSRLDGLNSTISTRYTWAPADFGQARMAALAWLYKLAGQQGTSQAEQVVSFYRERAGKKPLDVQALRDWIYFCAVRLDYAGNLAASRDLARAEPTDPIALWTFLHALAGRHTATGQRVLVTQGRSAEENVPPLDRADLDHVLSCYRGLVARRPELAQAEILQNIDDELRRAGRHEEEARFYRDAVAGATQIGRVAAVLNMAARRGDVDTLIELGERYERLQAGRSQPNFTTGSFTFIGPGLAMCQGMSYCADRKAYGDVLRLLDLNLAASRRRLERQSARSTRPTTSGTLTVARRSLQVIWMKSAYQFFTIDFPQVNEYLDDAAIQVLRQAFVIYQRDDLLSDLIAHFRRQAAAATGPASANQPRMALATLLWWSDARDEAVAELTKVVETSRPESDLRIDLAQLMEQQADYAGALALVDGVQPMDNRSLRRREEAALRLAVRTGNLERARQAAERLFGLRLDTETQIGLAGQMHQIGLHEMAEALTGRARRRAGNKATELVRLMVQYQRQDRTDQAVQVAMQILRSNELLAIGPTGADRGGPHRVPHGRDDGACARSGRLNRLIQQANDELKKTPNAAQIHQSLADYYTAARQTEKALAERLRVVELRPDDSSLRFQVAAQLAAEGKADAAVNQYKAAFKRDIGLLDRAVPTRIIEVFRQTHRVGELLDIFGDREIPTSVRIYFVTEMIQELVADARYRDRAMNLFRKYWRSNPASQLQMLYYFNSDAIWQIPEFYDLVESALVSQTASRGSLYDQWDPFQTMAGRVIGTDASPGRCPASRILEIAESRGRMESLGAEIARSRKTRPDWAAADFFLAIIAARSGRYEDARSFVRKLGDPRSRDPAVTSSIYPIYAFTVLGEELEAHTETQDAAIALYETAAFHPFSLAFTRFDRKLQPVHRLIALLERQGRFDEVRRVALRYARIEPPPESAEALIQQGRFVALRDMARKLVELGDPAEAVPMFSEALVLAEGITTDAPYYFSDTADFARQAREGLESILAGLDRQDLAPIAGRLIADALAAEPTARSATGATGPGVARTRDQAVNLLWLIHPRTLEQATVRSLLADSLDVGDPRQIAALDGPLEQLRRVYPEDLSVAIAGTLQALATGDAGRISPALERLDRLVEKTPLEALPAGVRSNSRQRALAARQIPLWLVARALDRRPDANATRALSSRLAARRWRPPAVRPTPSRCSPWYGSRAISPSPAATARRPRPPGAACSTSSSPHPRPVRADSGQDRDPPVRLPPHPPGKALLARTERSSPSRRPSCSQRCLVAA